MTRNLGATSLKRRRRAVDPMTAYDSLPPVLRRWLAEASLPWSPTSCRRIWLDARAKGEAEAEAIARLDRAERRTLARDRSSSPYSADH
ncbi:DUF6525 family protein [Pseudoruegeria sp. SK021]|uniref:DUF6525 family protein n=1 Tax=Pseudoruegeria sp. SK021 TaxID=1933035 RepID=UPI000A21AC25|nr:DUF6525 family protein [Pseudoruegeria sp. SK021]OSP53481.1 hypothetical protein BV911_17755 [Pseudoruegeria sp. SK021]